MQTIPSFEKRIDYIFDFCRPYLEYEDPTIKEVLNQSTDSPTDPIKNVADRTVQSRRNIQLKYKSRLGYTAKSYKRYQRFFKMISALQKALKQGQTIDWFDFIEDYDQSDQSHLIRDFNYFLNLRPTQYLSLY